MELTSEYHDTGTPIRLTTSRDTDKIVDSLKSFVEDYNALVEELNELAKGRSENLSLTGLVLTVYHSLVHYF